MTRVSSTTPVLPPLTGSKTRRTAHANGAGLNVDGLRQAIVMTGTEPPGFDELPALLSQHDADSDGRTGVVRPEAPYVHCVPGVFVCVA